MPRLDAATTAEWADLVAELDHWGEAGQVATLWWRDDDAVAATAALDALLQLAPEVPLALAVIPADAGPNLAAALAPFPQVAVLKHGWRHANHAAIGKKSEFPSGRSSHEVVSDLAAGQARLVGLFGARALAVLVPPWNRLDPSFLLLLADCGLTGAVAAKRNGRYRHVRSVSSNASDATIGGEAHFLVAVNASVQLVRRCVVAKQRGPVGVQDPPGGVEDQVHQFGQFLGAGHGLGHSSGIANMGAWDKTSE